MKKFIAKFLKILWKPYDRLEDFHIESILVTAFRQGSLENQAPAKPIDLTQLAATWKEKIKKMKEERLAKEDNN